MHTSVLGTSGRYGVTAVFIVFLFIIGIFMAVIFGCCSVPLAK